MAYYGGGFGHGFSDMGGFGGMGGFAGEPLYGGGIGGFGPLG